MTNTVAGNYLSLSKAAALHIRRDGDGNNIAANSNDIVLEKQSIIHMV